MLIFIKPIKQNDFISLYYLPIYKQIAPQFFSKNKEKKQISFILSKTATFFFIPLHKTNSSFGFS